MAIALEEHRQNGAHVARLDAERRILMITLTRILVATDFGQAAGAALDYGRALARTFGAKLTLLYVIGDIMTSGYGVDGYVAGNSDLQREAEEGARQQLDALLTERDRTDLGGKTVLLTSNSPAVTIIDFARDMNADVIIMGTHGRGAVSHLLMGSVAERVVRIAPCPVLTVKHPEHEFVLPDARGCDKSLNSWNA
jgi:nucleotide-binding universal stress UspA family protein